MGMRPSPRRNGNTGCLRSVLHQAPRNAEKYGKEPAKAYFSASACPSSGLPISCPLRSLVLIFLATPVEAPAAR
jgi:hypothetical protein